jgi:hypothetical protein
MPESHGAEKGSKKRLEIFGRLGVKQNHGSLLCGWLWKLRGYLLVGPSESAVCTPAVFSRA